MIFLFMDNGDKEHKNKKSWTNPGVEWLLLQYCVSTAFCWIRSYLKAHHAQKINHFALFIWNFALLMDTLVICWSHGQCGC